MKKYETPEIELINFSMTDVIATSGNGGYVPGPNEGELDTTADTW